MVQYLLYYCNCNIMARGVSHAPPAVDTDPDIFDLAQDGWEVRKGMLVALNPCHQQSTRIGEAHLATACSCQLARVKHAPHHL